MGHNTRYSAILLLISIVQIPSEPALRSGRHYVRYCYLADSCVDVSLIQGHEKAQHRNVQIINMRLSAAGVSVVAYLEKCVHHDFHNALPIEFDKTTYTAKIISIREDMEEGVNLRYDQDHNATWVTHADSDKYGSYDQRRVKNTYSEAMGRQVVSKRA